MLLSKQVKRDVQSLQMGGKRVSEPISKNILIVVARILPPYETYKTGSETTKDLNQDWSVVRHDAKESREVLKVCQRDDKAEDKFG